MCSSSGMVVYVVRNVVVGCGGICALSSSGGL